MKVHPVTIADPVQTDEPCEEGHFDCAHDEGGQCDGELMGSGRRCSRRGCSWFPDDDLEDIG
jgi:hypothetical protein